MQILHSLARDMRIDLCRRDITVPEQELDDTQIGAVIEQMRRERVPDRMRRKLLLDAGFLRVALDYVPEGLARHAIAPTRREQVFGLPLEQDINPRAGKELAQPALRDVLRSSRTARKGAVLDTCR